MFFETEDIRVEELAVFRLDWDKNVGNSGVRPYHSLSFRLRGDAVFFDGEESLHLHTGEILFIPAYRQYRMEAGAEELYVVHFTAQGDLPAQLRTFSPRNAAVFERMFAGLYDAWMKKRTGYRHECRGLLYGLFAGIEAEAADTENAAVHPLAAAQAYIHEHFTDGTLTVGFLAQMCGVSEAHFRRLFAQRCGVSPLEYINGLRLKYALELLSSGYYTVAAVSDACGFSSPYYFSAFIKRSTGYAPSDIIKAKNGQGMERNA